VDAIIAMIERNNQADFKVDRYMNVKDVVFAMCVQREPNNFSAQLYDMFSSEMEAYCLSVAEKLETNFNSWNDTQWLSVWVSCWEKFVMVERGVVPFFSYLDQFYTKYDDNILGLRAKAYRIYKVVVFDRFSGRVRDAVERTVARERNSEDSDRRLLRACTKTFEEMGTAIGQNLLVYRNELETMIISQASEFYSRKSRECLRQYSAPDYLEEAQIMLSQEKERVGAYLNHVTLEPLRKVCYEELLKKHQHAILNKPETGFHNMLSTGATGDLERLFTLYHTHASELGVLSELFEEHVSREGKHIVHEAPQPEVQQNPENGVVSKLITLHDKYDLMVNELFQGHPMFTKALKQAFRVFTNEDERVARKLAAYSNELLKKGSRLGVEKGDVERVLCNIASLYKYIRDKDVFERAYTLFLQMRLLNSQFENERYETEMILKLKHSNYQFTNRLEGMFKDMKISKDLLTSFLATDGKDYAGHFQFVVNVCRSSHWPRQNSHSRIVVPPDLRKICDSYKTFYLREHRGRRLDYRMEQGRADLSVWFHQDTRPYLLNVSTYQMIILLLFNEAVAPDYQISFEMILNRTGLRQHEVSHHVLSMCHPKVKVLKKSPNTPELNPADMLSLNPSYFNRQRHVTIPTIHVPQVLKEREEKEAKARTIRRKNMVEATIVRIMKARKKLKHCELVAEVISHLSMRFVPSPSDVKRRIEGLISQNYLERLPNDRGTYQYMP
jgi:hypothetical protein